MMLKHSSTPVSGLRGSGRPRFFMFDPILVPENIQSCQNFVGSFFDVAVGLTLVGHKVLAEGLE